MLIIEANQDGRNYYTDGWGEGGVVSFYLVIFTINIL